MKRKLVILAAILIGGCSSHSAAFTPAAQIAAQSMPSAPQSKSPGSYALEPMPVGPAVSESTMMIKAPDRTAALKPMTNFWSWAQLPGTLSQVVVSPDGTLWGVGAGSGNQPVWHWVGSKWVSNPGRVSRIAVAPDATLWGITAGGGTLYHYSNNTWTAVGGGSKDLTVDANGNVWVIANAAGNQAVWEYTTAGQWIQAPSGAANMIRSVPDTSLYVITTDGSPYNTTNNGSSWAHCLGGSITDLAPKPGLLGYWAIAGGEIYDISYGSAGNCTSGTYNNTGVTAQNISAWGNTIAIVQNGIAFTTNYNVLNTCRISTGYGYTPCALQSAYNLPSASAGTGMTVGVVDAYDDPNAEADLANYRSSYGLPACSSASGCFTKINQTGGTTPPTADSGWSQEISLDLDMVSAICPNCHIILVEANSNSRNDLGIAVNEAATVASVVSGSFGGPENSGDPTLYNPYYNHPTVPIVVSAGDTGYGAQFPAASPYVTAVGGTTLLPGTNIRGWTETVWNDLMSQHLGATGSGCSAYEAKPQWQSDQACPNRMIADVAAVADPSTPVAVYDTYGAGGLGWMAFGGTSASAPIIAGVYALGGHPSSQAPGSTYALTAQLYDVTLGNNVPMSGSQCGTPYFCNAEVGYDGPTGNGTPNGTGAFGGAQIASMAQRAAQLHVAMIGTIPGPGPAVAVCDQNPAPGYATCFAMRRTDIGSVATPAPWPVRKRFPLDGKP